MRSISVLTLFLVLLYAQVAFAGAGRPSAPPQDVKVGTPAPDFALKDMQGKQIRLSDLRGKVVFLNFWATWCPPCKAEMPSMERLNEVMGKKNFAMLAVNVEDDLEAVRSYLEKNPHDFSILLDPEAEVQNLYGVYRFPETLLIDKQGKIVQHYIGARDWSSVEFLKYVSSLINE